MRAVAERDRWLAAGLLAGLLLLGYLLLVHPWWTLPMMRLEDRLEALQQRDLRARAEINQQAAVAQRLQAVQARLAQRSVFMPQATAELATSALVQRLEEAVASASPGNRSCAITNRSPLEDAGRQRFARVTVQVRLKCGATEMATVLHSLESGAPRLFVDNLNVLATRYNYGGAGSGGGGGLDVTFDLTGYLQPTEKGGNARP